MTTSEMIENVRASFLMEGLVMSPEDEVRGRQIYDGDLDVADAVRDIKEKYMSLV